MSAQGSENIYGPVGECIYCGTSASKLSDEHIIPLSLGGEKILKEASCEKCAAITSKFELYCARKMLHSARTHFYWKSRKSKKPSTLTAGNIVGDVSSWREIPVEDHPAHIALPEFYPPGILLNRPPVVGGMMAVGIGAYFRPDFFEKSKKLGAGASVYTVFEVSNFVRILAKISHSYAVAKIGIHKFDPFLQGIILGTDERLDYYIGNMMSVKSGPSSFLHELSLREEYGIYLVKVRLYAKYGAHAYTVVVGCR